jgi:hypothetical protein
LVFAIVFFRGPVIKYIVYVLKRIQASYNTVPVLRGIPPAKEGFLGVKNGNKVWYVCLDPNAPRCAVLCDSYHQVNCATPRYATLNLAMLIPFPCQTRLRKYAICGMLCAVLCPNSVPSRSPDNKMLLNEKTPTPALFQKKPKNPN